MYTPFKYAFWILVIILFRNRALYTVACLVVGYFFLKWLMPKQNNVKRRQRIRRTRRAIPRTPVTNTNEHNIDVKPEEDLEYWRDLAMADPHDVLNKKKLTPRHCRRWKSYFQSVHIMPTIYEVDEEIEQIAASYYTDILPTLRPTRY